MKLMKQKIGIWGLGTTGKSVIKFLFNKREPGDYLKLEVTDRREPEGEEIKFLKNYKVDYTPHITQFLENNEFIIASPGVDLRPFQNYQYKFLSELDLFAQNWQKPIIAITGTVGKTSIVYLLEKIFEHCSIPVATGGNIGTGMLDLLEKQEKTQYALLEVSSFQLEWCKSFGPDLAILTNLYPNHIDRHGDIEKYFKAKYNIFANQTVGQQALVPWELKNLLEQENKDKEFIFFSKDRIDINKLDQDAYVYFIENDKIIKIRAGTVSVLCNLADLPQISYKENWLIIIAACDILQINLSKLKSFRADSLPQHRLEKIAEINGISFYNDSKSTIPQATLAAISALNTANICLFLGGVSKGVDRTEFIKELKDKVSEVVCFGAEAEKLHNACLANGIKTNWCKTLEDAFAVAVGRNHNNKVMLFSPAGASFDLFKNYQQRGDAFVKLVNEYVKTQSNL